MTESLAVRHRPRRFGDVAGQKHVVAVLRAAAAKKSPPQQLLLAGPSGTGKTTLARILAAALFCDTPAADGDACGQCDTCRDVTGPGGRHPDVIELDAASHGGIDQIREIGSAAHIAPMRAPWKLYIIDEAHGLTAAGGQAALRLIEEPPAHTLFALATTDPDKLPTALRGRCLPCEVLPPTRDDLHANLRRVCDTEGWGVGDATLDAILDVADPALGVRGTVMLLEKLANHLSRGDAIDPVVAHELLGVADPGVFTDLTAAVAANDRRAALARTAQALTSVTAPVLRAQLTAWARRTLREAVAAGHDETLPLHWYSTIATAPTFDGGLELAVAQMASPHLSGSPLALEALVARAEQAADRLAGAAASKTPDVAPAPAPTAAPAPPPSMTAAEPASSSAVGTHQAEPAAGVPPTAPMNEVAAPETVGDAVPLSDPQLLKLINTVGRGAGRAALLLRRATVHRADSHWVVRIDAADQAMADDLGFADRLTTAVSTLGGTVTVTS